MPFVGMTPEQINEAASSLGKQAHELKDIYNRVGRAVQEASANWHGKDLQAFVHTWRTSYASTMIAAAARLDPSGPTPPTPSNRQSSADSPAIEFADQMARDMAS